MLSGGFWPAITGTRFGGVFQLSISGRCVLLSMNSRAAKSPSPFTSMTSAFPSGASACPAKPNVRGYELNDIANIPSVSRTKSCFTARVGFGGPVSPPSFTPSFGAGAPRSGVGGLPRPRPSPGGSPICIRPSPLNPLLLGPLSRAGISSVRTYLSGSSIAISNSMGTRLSPCTCRVRPVVTNDLTEEMRLSPPRASLAALRMAAASPLDVPADGACASVSGTNVPADRPVTTARQKMTLLSPQRRHTIRLLLRKTGKLFEG